MPFPEMMIVIVKDSKCKTERMRERLVINIFCNSAPLTPTNNISVFLDGTKEETLYGWCMFIYYAMHITNSKFKMKFSMIE